MKKTIIMIAFAILLVASVFAAAPDPVTTLVELELKLTPKYSMGITTKEYTSDVYDVLDDKTKIKDDDIVKDGSATSAKIMLTYDADNYKLNPRIGLFVTYIFTEYNRCTLSMKIDKPLTCTSKADTASDYDTIDYKATVNVGSTTSENIKTVEDNNTDVELIKYDAKATKIAEAVYDSFGLTLKAKNESDTLEGKYIGLYKSNIILTLTENT